MTPQEIFDTVARHLFTQGERAGIVLEDDPTDDDKYANKGFSCRYRAPGGAKCAVGVLIPDEVYSFNMEERGVNDVYYAFAAVLPLWMGENLKLLASLQSVHDDFCYWQSTGSLRAALANVADFYNLNASVLDNLVLPSDER